ncbi:hypothetical protein [Sphingobacterium sp.]|uniref:hypothetical protein n=1 Tax=Sphingobacterium sp. TaxID=341027 RepID=UPI0028A80064|nr:hypothetical protein [Sphingobacterium sp.]
MYKESRYREITAFLLGRGLNQDLARLRSPTRDGRMDQDLGLNQDGVDGRIDQDLDLNQDGKDERMDQDLGLNQDGKDERIDQDLG